MNISIPTSNSRTSISSPTPNSMTRPSSAMPNLSYIPNINGLQSYIHKSSTLSDQSLPSDIK
jgi:hypothetical protein